MVRDNPLIRDLGNLPRLFRENYWAPVDRSNLYRPLTVASYALNRALTGPDAAGFHAVNIALHAATSLLLFHVCRRLGARTTGAFAATLLFAVHPLHAEAVTGIVGRAEILAAAGALGALALHAGPRPWCWLAALPALAGFFSKEIALGALAGLALHDLARARAGRRPSALAWSLLLGAAVFYLAVRWQVLGGTRAFATPSLSRLDNVLVDATTGTRLLTSASVLGRFAALTLAPARLSADYSYAEIPLVTLPPGSLGEAFSTGLGLLVAGASGLGMLWAVSRGRPGLAAGLGMFAGSYFIVSNSVVLIGTIMGERLFYLPSAGLAAAAAFALDRIIERRAAIALLVLLSLGLATRTALRNRDWRDQPTLFARTVETSPRSVRARVYHAEELRKSGNLAAARAELERAIQIDPREAWTWNALARFHGQAELERAQQALETALRLQPSFAEASYNLGAIHVWTGRFEEAVPVLEEALRLRPYYPDASLALGEAWLALGRLEPARLALADALAARPDRGPVLYAWGRLLEAEGQADHALAAYQLAMTGSEPPLDAFARAARLLSAQHRFREADSAIEHGRREHGDSAILASARGIVRLLAGDREGARSAFQKALELEPGNALARARLAELDAIETPQ